MTITEINAHLAEIDRLVLDYAIAEGRPISGSELMHGLGMTADTGALASARLGALGLLDITAEEGRLLMEVTQLGQEISISYNDPFHELKED